MQSILEQSHRIEILKALNQAIISNIQPLYNALQKDLHKSEQESYLTEIAFVLSEIEYNIKHLNKWIKPQKKCSPLLLFPSKSRILYQPYGTVLIIAPWNYPFRLLFAPLVAAVSAGNCVVLKPSHLAINTAEVCNKIICLTNAAINTTKCNTSPKNTTPLKIVTGGPKIMEQLLQQKFDYIFYTGGAIFGRTIAIKAAETLTPVTLELGGKSPCIVTAQANLKIAAKRIAWGKFLNCGQTCVAPDYVLIESTVKEEFVKHITKSIKELYGENSNQIVKNPFYGRIISTPAFTRLQTIIHSAINCNKILVGGTVNEADLFIEPTIIDLDTIHNPDNLCSAQCMQEEIFGPILPILTYSNIEDAINYINSKPKPLALYTFANKIQAKKILKETFSGGACINDTIMHIANNNLPFGGVGLSGMGNYHGKYGFETFSHKKSYVVTPRNFDLPLKYPPYKWFDIIKHII
ncbi:MAG: aldehyde dehydrogenase family protein [Bacteroidales bacterium]